MAASLKWSATTLPSLPAFKYDMNMPKVLLSSKKEQSASKSTFSNLRRYLYFLSVTVYRPKPEDNENHSLIDLTIDEVEVKLSAVSLLEGRGIVTELTARGMRGLLDRRTEKPDPNYKAVRRTWQRGDFEFEKLIVEDVLVTV